MMMLKEKDNYRVGVLSDTHGMLRDCLYPFFSAVDLIIHAGDVGRQIVLQELQRMAPVVAVRGNTDGRWAEGLLPLFEMVSVGGVTMAVLHDLLDLDLDPRAAGVGVVISGHTHQPLIETRDDVLYLNPGSIGPRRFDYPVSAALIEIRGTTLTPEILTFTL